MFTLLTNARVFSPEDLGLCSLLIHADRIVAVEKDISLFDGVNEIIDCRGKWVIPGIIRSQDISWKQLGSLSFKPLSRTQPQSIVAFGASG